MHLRIQKNIILNIIICLIKSIHGYEYISLKDIKPEAYCHSLSEMLDGEILLVILGWSFSWKIENNLELSWKMSVLLVALVHYGLIWSLVSCQEPQRL